MYLRRTLTILLTAALVLPIVELVLLGLGRLLAALGDASGAAVLDRIGLGGGIVWVIVLVCLLLTVAIQSLPPPDAGR
jgi:hypothetical protein